MLYIFDVTPYESGTYFLEQAHDSSSSDSDYYVDWNSDDDMEIDNLVQSSYTKTSLDLVQMGFSDEMFATLVDMGFSIHMISRAIKEAGEAFTSLACILM